MIKLSQIDMGERGRKEYPGIEELADSIVQNGLIQPIVIEELGGVENEPHDLRRYLLRAGGRRLTALKYLGVEDLYHATSSEPGKPGYLLANVTSDQLRGLLIEIAENHDRVDMNWREDLALIVKAFRLWELVKHEAGEKAVMRQFGAMHKVPYAQLKRAILIHDDVLAAPDRYAECDSIRAAYGVYLKITSEALAKVAAEKSFQRIPAFNAETAASSVGGPLDPSPEGNAPIVNLSTTVLNVDSLAYMKACPDLTFDHIVTDPDYAIEVSALNANSAVAQTGVIQTSVSDSLSDFRTFITEAFRITRGFCVFFYDVEHQEKLKDHALSVGWRVQRWPLIWHKIGFTSNAAPNHNFPKNIEYAMVLRKPGVTLNQVQTSCLFAADPVPTQKKFGHPFSKPIDLTRWIYKAIAFKGQVVLDPFAGRGSMAYAAVLNELNPVAIELNPHHFSDLQLNLQGAYRQVLGTSTQFV